MASTSGLRPSLIWCELGCEVPRFQSPPPPFFLKGGFPGEGPDPTTGCTSFTVYHSDYADAKVSAEIKNRPHVYLLHVASMSCSLKRT